MKLAPSLVALALLAAATPLASAATEFGFLFAWGACG